MTNHVNRLRLIGVVLLPVLLWGCPPNDSSRSTAGGPKSNQSPGPSPREVRASRDSKIPELLRADDVPGFIAAASAAPVSQREDIRAILVRARGNSEIARRLIAEFEAAQSTDFSRALVILSLLGEQGNPAATEFFVRFLRKPLPTDGLSETELGLSDEADALGRLQVKAANALPYPRTREALQATLEVVKSHPVKAVRVEAASSYLWNAGNGAEARRTLAGYLREDERLLLDRPVRDAGMGARQFNAMLSQYLERHPELRPPAPAHGTTREQKGRAPSEQTASPPAGA